MAGFIIGLIMVIIGAIITIKSDWFYRNFGTIPSFEKYLGTEGGSRLGYQLIGIIVCILGFMTMTNLIGAFLMGTVGRLFSGNF